MELRHFKLAALALTGLLAAAPLVADSSPNLDVQDSMEDLRASLGTLSNQVNNLQAWSDKAIVWGVNTDLRYDRQIWEQGTLSGAQAYVPGSAATYKGTEGMYAKRVELEATGKISSWAVWNLQYDFAGAKLEDLGVDATGLDLLPFVNVPGYSWETKVGLYRQPFGIENQTGSSSIPFPERALMDGGAFPIKPSTTETKLAVGVAAGNGLKLIYERVMGVQMITSHNYGPVGYKLQFAAADDDQDNGASPGTPGASLGITTNQDPSEIGRLGIDLNFVPTIVKLNVGGSFIHNPTTAIFDGSTAAGLTTWQDTTGADFTLEVPMAQTKFWGEWVGQNTYLNGNAAETLTTGNFRSEAWYVDATIKPMAFFDKDWTNVELSGRVENDVPDILLQSVAPAGTICSYGASTVGLKYYYSGKNYTSINYSCYALNGDYSTIGGSNLLSVQQQFNY